MSGSRQWIPHPDQRFVPTIFQGENNDLAPDVRDIVREMRAEQRELGEDTEGEAEDSTDATSCGAESGSVEEADEDNEEAQEDENVSLVSDSDAEQETSDQASSGPEPAASLIEHGSEVFASRLVTASSGSEDDIVVVSRRRRRHQKISQSSAESSESDHGRQASEPMSISESSAESDGEEAPLAPISDLILPEEALSEVARSESNIPEPIAGQNFRQLHQYLAGSMGLDAAGNAMPDSRTNPASNEYTSTITGPDPTVAPPATGTADSYRDRNRSARERLADMRRHAPQLDYPTYMEEKFREQQGDQPQRRGSQGQDRTLHLPIPVQNPQRTRVVPETADPAVSVSSQQRTRVPFPSMSQIPRNDFADPQILNQSRLSSLTPYTLYCNRQDQSITSQINLARAIRDHPQPRDYPLPQLNPTTFGSGQEAYIPPHVHQQGFGDTGYGNISPYQTSTYSPYAHPTNPYSNRPQNPNSYSNPYSYDSIVNEQPRRILPQAALLPALPGVQRGRQSTNNMPTAPGFNLVERSNPNDQLSDQRSESLFDADDVSIVLSRQNRKRKARVLSPEDEGDVEAEFGGEEEAGESGSFEENRDVSGEDAGLPEDDYPALTPNANPQTTGVVTNENDREPGRGFGGKVKFWCRMNPADGFQVRATKFVNWRNAIRHDDIRENLLAAAHARSRFRFPRKRGPGRLDITSCTPEQQNWDFKNRNTWPTIMFRFEKRGWQGHPDLAQREPQGDWMWRGRVIVDRDNRPLRDFRLLNHCCSSRFEGETMEFLSRNCPKIEPRDYWGRTLDVGRVPTAQAFNTRKSRFRGENGLIAWRTRDGSEKFREATRERLGEWGVRNNSTRHFTGFSPEKIKELERQNKDSESSLKKSATHQKRRKAKEDAKKEAREAPAAEEGEEEEQPEEPAEEESEE